MVCGHNVINDRAARKPRIESKPWIESRPKGKCGQNRPSGVKNMPRLFLDAAGGVHLTDVEGLQPHSVLQQPARKYPTAQPHKEHPAGQPGHVGLLAGGRRHGGAKDQALCGVEGQRVPVGEEVSVIGSNHPERTEGRLKAVCMARDRIGRSRLSFQETVRLGLTLWLTARHRGYLRTIVCG